MPSKTHASQPYRYATSPQLNSFSALIHSFYMAESSPSPAIHLTLDPDSLKFTAYTASPIGTTPRPDQLAFVPVESIMRVHEQERAGIDLLTSNLTSLADKAPSTSAELNKDLAIRSPLATMHGLLTKVSVMLDAVLEYVRAVAAGEKQGDERVGRALLETVGAVPSSSSSSSSAAGPAAVTPANAANVSGTAAATGKTDAKSFEEDFNAHLADVLMVSGHPPLGTGNSQSLTLLSVSSFLALQRSCRFRTWPTWSRHKQSCHLDSTC